MGISREMCPLVSSLVLRKTSWKKALWNHVARCLKSDGKGTDSISVSFVVSLLCAQYERRVLT